MGGCGLSSGVPVAFVIAAQDELVLFIARWCYKARGKCRFTGVSTKGGRGRLYADVLVGYRQFGARYVEIRRV